MPAAAAGVLNVISLEASYKHCRNVARSRAKNFYPAFLLLPKHKREAMCAIYAFMRECDDLSDNPAPGRKVREDLAQWRVDMDRALNGEPPENPIWPAFADTARKFNIPHRFFHEMIDGVTSDLDPKPVQTFAELYSYCYKVASVVGLTVVHIWGFDSPRALLLAEKCGIAFQLTNILRDVREDAELGRVYLPREDLEKFGISERQLRYGTEDDQFRSLMRFEAERARRYYQESSPLMAIISRDSRSSLWALRQIYSTLLRRLDQNRFSVLSRRLNVPKATKVRILLQAFLQRS